MKNKANILTLTTSALALLALATPILRAAEKDHKHEDHAAGPNGGRVIHEVEPHVEFLVTADRKVQITVLDEKGKAAPLGDLSVSVTGGSRSKPTRMKFEKKGELLVSDTAFPEGNDFPVVVQIKPTANSKPVIEKFNLNLNDCPTCEYKEYACVCEHGDHDQDKKKK